MSLFDDDNFHSLVAAREARTGEWLGSEYISDEWVRFDADGPEWDDVRELDSWEEDRAQDAYDNSVYGP